jgi:DNA invertase Pin-like site-specific DNA recombinase
MKIVAYFYRDPLLEDEPEPVWGEDVDRVYRDFGDRHQRSQLLADCQVDPPDCILIRHLADLADSMPEITSFLEEFARIHVSIVTIGSIVSPESPTTTLKLLHAVQTEQHRRRVRRGHARKRLQASLPPGAAPYGYRRGQNRYTLNRSTAPIVKEFFEQFLLYGSLRGAVRHIARRYGKVISVSTGRRWLTSPVYRGDLAYNTGHVILNTHVPIISRQEAAQVDRLLRRNRTVPRRAASAPRSLAGLVVCASCGSGMSINSVTRRSTAQNSTDRNSKHSTKASSTSYLYLRPIACPHQSKCKAVDYDQVLDQTIQRICQDLPEAVSAASLPDLQRIQQGIHAAIRQHQTILSQLPDLTQSGIFDPETAALRAYKLQATIAELQGKLAQLPPVDLAALLPTVSLAQFWLDLSESERRFYFREFIQQIHLVRNSDNTWHIQLQFIF